MRKAKMTNPECRYCHDHIFLGQLWRKEAVHRQSNPGCEFGQERYESFHLACAPESRRRREANQSRDSKPLMEK